MRALLLVLLLGACKTDPPATKPPAAPSAPTPKSTSSPAPASIPDATSGEPLDVTRVAQLAPTLPNADRMTTLAVQARFGRARESWCTRTADPGQAAAQIAAVLSRDGWTDVASRSNGERAAISGLQDDVHITVSLGGTDPACEGGLVTEVVYQGTALQVPALEPGEKVH